MIIEEHELRQLRNLRIGAVVTIGRQLLQCRKVIGDGNPCEGCAVGDMGITIDKYPEQCAGIRYCMSGKRKDKVSVRFVEL